MDDAMPYGIGCANRLRHQHVDDGRHAAFGVT